MHMYRSAARAAVIVFANLRQCIFARDSGITYPLQMRTLTAKLQTQ